MQTRPRRALAELPNFAGAGCLLCYFQRLPTRGCARRRVSERNRRRRLLARRLKLPPQRLMRGGFPYITRSWVAMARPPTSDLRPPAPLLALRATSPVPGESVPRGKAFLFQICCSSFKPSLTPASSASTSSAVLSAQRLTRRAVRTVRSLQPMASSVWLGSPLSQAEPPET